MLTKMQLRITKKVIFLHSFTNQECAKNRCFWVKLKLWLKWQFYFELKKKIMSFNLFLLLVYFQVNIRGCIVCPKWVGKNFVMVIFNTFKVKKSIWDFVIGESWTGYYASNSFCHWSIYSPWRTFQSYVTNYWIT